MAVGDILRKFIRPALRCVGLRPPDYKSMLQYGEVCMDNIELHGLVRAIKQLSISLECIVEIGSYCGGSTVVIGKAATRINPGAKIYAIEPFSFHENRYQYEYESVFDQNVADWELKDIVVKVKQTSDQVAPEWRRPIEFLYVDGDHRYESVARDIKNFVPFVRSGGVIAFHDYKPIGKEGVKQAIDELVFPKHEWMFTMGSLICFKKKESPQDSLV